MDKTPKGPINSQKKKNEKKQITLSATGAGSLGLVDQAAVSRSISIGRITEALSALDNSRTVSVLETKDGCKRTIVYDPSVLKVIRALFSGGMVYPFRLAATVVPYATDGAGSMLATSTFSPAVATYPEWSGLSALFDEVNLQQARWTLIGGASGLKNVGFVIGYNPNNVSATPASTTAVANLANSKLISSYTTLPVLYKKTVRIPRGRAWAETTVPAVASPPAGCVGTFDIANAGAAAAVASTYFYGFMEIGVVLRNRI